MEREHIYFRGQADALAYLNKVGAFKMEQWLKTLRSDLHRLYIVSAYKTKKKYAENRL